VALLVLQVDNIPPEVQSIVPSVLGGVAVTKQSALKPENGFFDVLYNIVHVHDAQFIN